MRIAVIGAGFGGLSAAIRLVVQGHDVTIFEQRDKPGGSAYVFERDGFTFDAGPTIITAPHIIDDVFAAAGRDRRDYVDFIRVDPAYNIRFSDGSVFHYYTDEAKLRDEVAKFSPGDVAGFDAFTTHARAIFDAAMPLIDKPFDSFAAMLRLLPTIARLRADRSVAAIVNTHFRDPRLRQVFSFHPLLVGGNPFDTTSIYALIHRLELEWGVWFARGGTGQLVNAMVRVFEEAGGRILLDTPVQGIMADGRGNAAGVLLASGQIHAADAVVCNAEVMQAPPIINPPGASRAVSIHRSRRLKSSMSLVVMYFGTTRTYPDRAHHEILMGPRYQELLSDIFERKVLASDFSLYLHRPTATDGSLAPPGCDAWYVLSPVPNLEGEIDWETAGPRYRDAILGYLQERHLPDLSKHLVSQSMIDPRYFRDQLNARHGSAFSLVPEFLQSAWFRPHNRSSVRNLYFAGAGTHPGAGVPGVISSGKIVADLIGSA